MSVDFEAIRKQEWPVLEQMVFLDAACVSFAPQRTVRAVKAFADMTATQEEENSSAHHIAMDSLRGKAYDEAAKLLNADPEEIALVESTSHGLNIAARGIELADGDNIITTNLEFIQVALPWCVMRREKKIEIRVCKTKDNRFTVDDFAALADERTRIIVMSTLEWCNGWASDMKAIGDFCQEKGIFLVVDAVQQLGVTKIDTKQCHFDLLVAGGHKWLNSPYGTGVLYVNKNSLSKIKQSYAGYLNTTVPEGGWGATGRIPPLPPSTTGPSRRPPASTKSAAPPTTPAPLPWGRAWAWSTRSASRTSRNTSGRSAPTAWINWRPSAPPSSPTATRAGGAASSLPASMTIWMWTAGYSSSSTPARFLLPSASPTTWAASASPASTSTTTPTSTPWRRL